MASPDRIRAASEADLGQIAGGSEKVVGPNIIGNLEEMSQHHEAYIQRSAANDRMSLGSAVLAERNMNLPQFTRTPTKYSMKDRVQ